MITRSSFLPVCGVIDLARSTSFSRFRPSGVSSKAQEKTSAGMKPIASAMTMPRGSQAGASNIGSTVLATCTISHAPTR